MGGAHGALRSLLAALVPLSRWAIRPCRSNTGRNEVAGLHSCAQQGSRLTPGNQALMVFSCSPENEADMATLRLRSAPVLGLASPESLTLPLEGLPPTGSVSPASCWGCCCPEMWRLYGMTGRRWGGFVTRQGRCVPGDHETLSASDKLERNP